MLGTPTSAHTVSFQRDEAWDRKREFSKVEAVSGGFGSFQCARCARVLARFSRSGRFYSHAASVRRDSNGIANPAAVPTFSPLPI